MVDVGVLTPLVPFGSRVAPQAFMLHMKISFSFCTATMEYPHKCIIDTDDEDFTRIFEFRMLQVAWNV